MARSQGLLATRIAGAARARSAAAKTSSDRELVDVYAAVEGAHVGEVLPGGPEHFIEVIDSPKYSVKVHEYGHTYTAGAVTQLAYNEAKTEAIAARMTIYGISHSEGGGLIRGVIAHEVFHIFEARMSGSEAVSEGHEGWLEEGAATWVEADLVKSDRTARDEWSLYLKAPQTPLFSRVYEGIGFFAHLASVGMSPWSRFKSMFATTSSAAAYAAAGGASTTSLDSEASAFFREPKFGSEWDTSGQNVPSRTEVGFHPTQREPSRRARPRSA